MTIRRYLAVLGAVSTLAGLSACALPGAAPNTSAAQEPIEDKPPVGDSVRERVIIGADNRRVTPPDYDWVARTVGRLEYEVPEGGVGSCSATSIGPRHLLTAAHCVYHPTNGHSQLVENIYFYPGANQHNQMPYGRFRVTRVYHPANLNPDAIMNEILPDDLAVLEVGSDHTGRNLLQRVGARGFWGTRSLSEGTMTTLGYPGDKEYRVQYYEENCRFQVITDKVMRTDCDVFRGQSGSPALVSAPGRTDKYIHGVLTAENHHLRTNLVTRLTPERQRIIAAILRDEYDPQTSQEPERWLAVTAPDTQRIHIVVHNTCRAPRLVALNHLDPERGWVAEGFYHFEPGQSLELARTRNSIFYLSAYDDSGQPLIQGSHRATVRGSQINMLQFNHNHFGDAIIPLCN